MALTVVAARLAGRGLRLRSPTARAAETMSIDHLAPDKIPGTTESNRSEIDSVRNALTGRFAIYDSTVDEGWIDCSVDDLFEVRR
jgi:hypothetical protein